MTEIVNYKTITVTGYMGNNENSFTSDINLDFQPDEVVVKLIIFDNAINVITDRIYIIKTDLIDNNILAPLEAATGFIQPINIPYKINKSINGQYTFSIWNYDGSEPDDIADFEVALGITLTFIKYKTPFYLR